LAQENEVKKLKIALSSKDEMMKWQILEIQIKEKYEKKLYVNDIYYG
jgi:hypothetical protein